MRAGVWTIVGGEVVGEHDDGLACLLGLLDGGLEPGHLLGVPAVCVCGLQFLLQGQLNAMYQHHIPHILSVCMCMRMCGGVCVCVPCCCLWV